MDSNIKGVDQKPTQDQTIENGAELVQREEQQAWEDGEKPTQHNVLKPENADVDTEKTLNQSETLNRFKEENDSLRGLLMETRFKMAAQAANVLPERISFVQKIAKLDGIDICSADADEKIKAAIMEIRSQLPEWFKTSGTGSAGNFRRMSYGQSEMENARAQFENGMRR